MVLENVDRPDAHYGEGRIHYRHIMQRLLQHLHQITTIIYLPPDDYGGAQGVRRAEKLKCCGERASWTIAPPKWGPMRKEDTTFDDLQKKVKKPTCKARSRAT